MMEELAELLAKKVKEIYGLDVQPEFSRTDEVHGDFSTNLAMQLAQKIGRPPRDAAEELAEALRESGVIKEVNVAGPGFINVRLSDAAVFRDMYWKKPVINQTILLEYSCPNAFKELHTGHLYQTLIGDSMARIYEYCQAKVYRTSFGGDVGLHAAKCLWGILQALGGENPAKLTEVENRPSFISDAYVQGSKMYEADEAAKAEIEAINKRIYGLFESGNLKSNFAKIYFTTRQWSYDYFDDFYRQIKAHDFDTYYPESQTLRPGLEMVKAHPEIFTESDGAVVLDEAKSGLHTRVFITSAGLPTYETIDLGVIQLEAEQFPYDKRIIITGNDQEQYMKVVFAALKLVDPELGAKQRHVTNGTVRLSEGKKKSSRLGNVSKASDVLRGVEAAIEQGSESERRDIALGAIKYSLLKGRVGGDLSFDLDQSISLEGNSGPYLQYALVRARSILRKLGDFPQADTPEQLDEHERRLAFKLTEMPEAILKAQQDYSPHHICTYLYELASVFNRFYENSRVIDDPRTSVRATLVKHYENTLALGLELLGIPAPEAM